MGVLEGKVALVTGASRGVGAAIARSLAREGAAVIVNYLKSADKAEGVARSIRGEGGKGGELRRLSPAANQVSRWPDAQSSSKPLQPRVLGRRPARDAVP